MSDPTATKPATAPCSLLRRFAAMFYDSLLLIALWMFATLLLLPFSGGEAIASGNLLYLFYLYLIACLYYDWHWRHGGQTLGMRAWQIRLLDAAGRPLMQRQSLQRLLLATLSLLIGGLGFFWSWLDKDGLTLHDRYSGSWPVKLAASGQT